MAYPEKNAAPASERGMRIMEETGCRVGAHVFVWTGTMQGSDAPPAFLRCLCGLLEYPPVAASQTAQEDQ